MVDSAHTLEFLLQGRDGVRLVAVESPEASKPLLKLLDVAITLSNGRLGHVQLQLQSHVVRKQEGVRLNLHVAGRCDLRFTFRFRTYRHSSLWDTSPVQTAAQEPAIQEGNEEDRKERVQEAFVEVQVEENGAEVVHRLCEVRGSSVRTLRDAARGQNGTNLPCRPGAIRTIQTSQAQLAHAVALTSSWQPGRLGRTSSTTCLMPCGQQGTGVHQS